MVKNTKFNSLTPELLEENQTIYTEALDFAFEKNDIKNIAITGIYGAGKSSVWRTYEYNKRLKNVITVSLGKYEDSLDDEFHEGQEGSFRRELDASIEKLIDEEANSKVVEAEVDYSKDKSNHENISPENRLEKQLINQILSQIPTSKIPLSTYRFKKNKKWLELVFQVLVTLLFVASIFIWVSREEIISDKNFEKFLGDKPLLTLLFLCGAAFFLPIGYFLYGFYKENRIRLSRINLKGAEANLKDDDAKDESILDRDIKEIVYALSYSDTEIVVFEDLDRHENIVIFTKLRELNFLLNSYLDTIGENRVIRFVYMLRDGLFVSKNRTKFFDFVLPIVPIVDSKNSESKLLKFLEKATHLPDNATLSRVSLYIDDMRLLKNIVNEYLVYENVISIDELELDSNKLFSLVVLKNIFPQEFDLLQSDRGYIFGVFKNVERYKQDVRDKLIEEISEIDDELVFLNNQHVNSKFEAMAALIPPNVRIHEIDDSSSWTEFLKKQEKNPSVNFTVNYITTGSNSRTTSYSYKTFVEKYILINDEIKAFIEKMPLDRKARINELNREKTTLERTLRDKSLGLVRDQLQSMSPEEISDIFSVTDEKITKSHYFSLIRALILQGLIDETYWHYKGYFYKGSLGKNDTIFIKNLLEAKKQDIFLNIENPIEVINRLDLSDYSKFNILNQNLFELSVELGRTDELLEIMDSIKSYDNYDSLLQILDANGYKFVKKFIDIILLSETQSIIEILDRCEASESKTFENILIAIFTNNNIGKNILELFKTYLEQNENLISIVSEDEFNQFIDNISIANAKFVDVSETQASRERIQKIEETQSYRLDVKNVEFILGEVLSKSIKYNKLLNDIYHNESLLSTREYIESNFNDFISLYIDENIEDVGFMNEENIVVKILNSDVSDEHKRTYVKYNETLLSDITQIEEISKKEDLIEILLENNKVLFSLNNVNAYWEEMGGYSRAFTKYFDENLNEENYEVILSGNKQISNSFINDSSVSDKVFLYSLKCADKAIDDVDELIPQDRIRRLIEVGHFSITTDNLTKMINNEFYDEIVILIIGISVEQENEAISLLMSLDVTSELIYRLVNSDITDDNAIKLLKLILDDVSIERISFSKIASIGYLIDNGLSEENINYICKHFDTFKLQDKFIEYLDTNSLFSKIKNENIDDTFIQMILSSPNISIDSKIDTIIIRVKNRCSKKELMSFISMISEVSELIKVWNDSRPKLDNEYKQKLGEALEKAGYVTIRNDKDCRRISERKQKLDKFML